MKKIFYRLLIPAMTVMMLMGCGPGDKNGETGRKTDSETKEDGGEHAYAEKKPIEMLHIIVKDRLPERPTLFDQRMLERYNLEFDYVDVQESAAKQKITLMFASNDYPEMIMNINSAVEEVLNLYALDGYLRKVNDWFHAMPNYTNLWTDESFSYLLDLMSAADGNLYLVPGKNYASAQITWIYRQDVFDSLGLPFPETVDDLYTAMKAIKNKVDGSIPMVTKAGVEGILSGLMSAYFTNFGPYEHPMTGEFHAYGEVTEEFRECVKWASRWYREGLIPRDFVTMSGTQYQEIYTRGLNAIEHIYCSRAVWGNGLVQQENPQARWAIKMDGGVSEEPEHGFLYTRNTPAAGVCYAFTEKIDDQKMSRMIDFIDWMATDEGAVWWSMGEEGLTWEYDGDAIIYKDFIFESQTNPEGKQLWEYGLAHDYRIFTPQAFAALNNYTITNMQLSRAFDGNANARYFPQYAYRFTVEEETRYTELQSAIEDVRDEYLQKFIMGVLDPYNDGLWQEYVAALNAVGLAEAGELITTVYRRAKGE